MRYRPSAMGIRELAILAHALAWVLVAVPASADPNAGASFELEWLAPSDCPSEVEIRQSIERRVRRAQPVSQVLEVRVLVEAPVDEIWRCELRTRSGAVSGSRTLEAESCAA